MATIPLGTFSVTLKCPTCGPTNMRPSDPTDGTVVFCDTCGKELGRWPDVLGPEALKAAMPDIEKAAIELARKAFKNFK